MTLAGAFSQLEVIRGGETLKVRSSDLTYTGHIKPGDNPIRFEIGHFYTAHFIAGNKRLTKPAVWASDFSLKGDVKH